MKKLKQTKGITLVALVITIIILLILAGISIQAITNTGIFTQANNAKRESEIASIKEQIALDIYEKQLVPPLGSITEEQLETILGKYGTVNKEDGTIVGITTGKGYEILLKDIYGGETVAESVPESVPDGAIVTPVNDITTWLKTGEISKQYSYTTIEQVIADSTCTQSLMNNENAMKYLARSTEFAEVICESETAMTYLGQSAYVDDAVLNSDSWKQFIKASEYWSLVYASKVVTVYGATSETITIDGYYGSLTTGTNGSCSHVVPIDTITLTGSVSGQSFTRTVTSETTEVYVMPEGALYWYGNECEWITDGFSIATTFNPSTCSKNTNNVQFNNVGKDAPCTISSNSKINLNGFSTLHTIYNKPYTTSSGYINTVLYSLYPTTSDKFFHSGEWLVGNIYYGSADEYHQSSVDIPSSNKEFYVILMAMDSNSYTNFTAYTYAIWIE